MTRDVAIKKLDDAIAAQQRDDFGGKVFLDVEDAKALLRALQPGDPAECTPQDDLTGHMAQTVGSMVKRYGAEAVAAWLRSTAVEIAPDGDWTPIEDAPRQEPLLFRTYAQPGQAAVGVVNALGEVCTLWGQNGIGFSPTHCMEIPELSRPAPPRCDPFMVGKGGRPVRVYEPYPGAFDHILGEEPEQISACEGCNRPIMAGDPAHIAEDVALCAECAPSYRDMQADPDSFLNTETREPMTADEARAFCEAYESRGGSLDDKMLSGKA